MTISKSFQFTPPFIYNKENPAKNLEISAGAKKKLFAKNLWFLILHIFQNEFVVNFLIFIYTS